MVQVPDGTAPRLHAPVLPVAPVAPPAALEAPPADHVGDLVREAMVGVTTEAHGTGRSAMKGLTYRVAGKTGTAQVFTVGQQEKYKEGDVEERLRDHSWFTAYAPADQPRIAVAVIVENGGFGADAAAPVVRKILEAYFAAEGYVARER